MRKFSISVFIIFLISSNHSSGAINLDAVRNSLIKAAKHLQNGRIHELKRMEMTEALEEVEKKLWGESFGELSEHDFQVLTHLKFHPRPILHKIDENRFILDQTNTREGLFEKIPTDSPIVLRWWNQTDFRNYIFPRITKKDLTMNQELLLNWWKEAKRKGKASHLSDLILESIAEASIHYGDDLSTIINSDPFLRTVFKAMSENELFADDMEHIVEELLKKLRVSDSVSEESA